MSITSVVPRGISQGATTLASPTFKHRDVEEPVDYWVNRRIAALVVRVLARLPVTPNQVTVLSGLFGIVSGATIAFSPVERRWQVPLGGFVLFCSIVLDCADGQLARLKGESSMVGRMLDGTVDAVSVGAVFLGLAVFTVRAGFDPFLVYALGWGAGFSMKWHTHAYDHAKNVYLKNVLPAGDRSNPLPTFEEIARERDVHAAKGDWFGALVLAGFLAFTRSQRKGWQAERVGLGAPETQSEEERNAYRGLFRPAMRVWTWNGLATHLTLFLVATAVTPWFHGAALAAWLVIVGPLNLMTLGLEAAERRTERYFQATMRPLPMR